MFFGQDVSNWQGAYAWPSNLKFGFAKATEGTGYADPYFAHNWSALKAKGMVRGAYHFAHTNNNATTEAKHFLAVVRAQGLETGDLLSLDLEVTDGQSASHIASWAKTWCEYVKAQTGVTPILYTYRSFASSYCAGLGVYPLWIADPTTAGKPRLAGPWKSWVIHQYSTASGIDHDCTNLSVAELRALGGGAAPEEDEVTKTVSIGVKKAVQLKAGKKTRIEFDVEYDDEGQMHANGAYPGILDRPCKATTEVTVSGATGTAELVAHNMKTGKESSLGVHPMGTPFVALTNMYSNQHLYLDLTADKDVEVKPYAKCNYVEEK